MPRCYFCRQDLELKDRVMRKDTCLKCGRDLHSCVQCRFHDRAYHNQCREPKAAMVGERERANVCDYFEFGSLKSAAAGAEQDKARRALDDLFKKKK